MSRRILLADDSVTIQKVIELTFMDEDFEVHAVSNGDEAVALLPQARPDFVIADVHMPGANGYEVCRRAKQELPGVPVLLLVGTFEPFDEGQARSAGADSFLKKPFDSQELLQRVQELLAASAPPAPDAPDVPAAQAPAVMAVPEPALEEPEPFAFPASGFELEPEPARQKDPFRLGGDAPFPLEDTSASLGGGAPFPLSLEPPEPEDRSYAFRDDRPFQIEDDSVLEVAEPRIGLRNESDESPYADPQDRFIADPQDRFREDEAPAAFPQASMGFGPMELTDQERLGVPLGQEPLVESLEEAEERIAEERPRTFDVAAPHEPMSPGAGGAFAPPLPMTAEGGGTADSGGRSLSDDDVDRIARRVVELIGDKAVRDVAWEVIPDLAEVVIKTRLRELESQID